MSHTPTLRFAFLLLFLLPACGKLERQETEIPSLATPAPGANPALSPSPAPPAGKTWTDIPAAQAQDRITIHYHRSDADYSAAVLWSWDAYQKNTPAQNELAPLGQDDFGAVFQLDRAQYGNSDKIGLIPRLGHDWSRKDGADRIWSPNLGNEIWIISGKPALFARKPSLTPLLEAAYADQLNQLDFRISYPVEASMLGKQHLHLSNENREPIAIQELMAVGTGQVSEVKVILAAPLDIAHHRYTASIDQLGQPKPVMPRGLLDDPDLYYSPNAVLGATYSPSSTVFRAFAPTAQAMSVVLYNEAASDKGRMAIPMQAEAKGIWSAVVNGNLSGRFYMLHPEGPEFSGEDILDPYATNSVNSSSRARITPRTPAPFPLAMHPASPTDRVVYEMHVRDFTVAPNSGITPAGLYTSWTQPGTRLREDPRIKTGLDHLAELGVTDVQIMPVQDFANDEYARAYNWGYITSDFFSPEGMFATNPADDSRVRELKALIGSLHQRGIGVIMDVVYNHTSESAPFLSLAPGYYYRHLPDGTFSNGSGCGNEFKSEAPMARKYLLDSLKYWVREYGVDGFRFDLIALIDQEAVRQMEKELHAINPSLAIYGEPWTGGDTVLQAKTDKSAFHQVSIGAFNDDFRNALHGHPEGTDAGFIQDGSNRDALQKAIMVSDWFDAPWQSVNYMTCHDNLVLWDKLKISMPGANDQMIKAAEKLGYLVLFTSPGMPFFQGGEEFGRSKGGNPNSYDSPDAVNEVDWSLKKKNYDLFTYVRDLIALRKQHPLFRLRTRADVTSRLKFLPTPDDKTLAFEINSYSTPGESWRRAIVIANPSADTAAQMSLPDGEWQVACDEKGSSLGRTLSGKLTVPPKAGLILYQE